MYIKPEFKRIYCQVPKKTDSLSGDFWQVSGKLLKWRAYEARCYEVSGEIGLIRRIMHHLLKRRRSDMANWHWQHVYTAVTLLLHCIIKLLVSMIIALRGTGQGKGRRGGLLLMASCQLDLQRTSLSPKHLFFRGRHSLRLGYILV